MLVAAMTVTHSYLRVATRLNICARALHADDQLVVRFTSPGRMLKNENELFIHH